MWNELNEPKVSPAKAAYHLKQLRKLFPRAGDQRFLQMVWAIDALRSGHPEAAARLLTFPQQAADQSIGSRFAVHQWELETLLIQLLLTPKEDPQPGAPAVFDCSRFDSVADLVNRLRKLENVESAIYLRGGGFNMGVDGPDHLQESLVARPGRAVRSLGRVTIDGIDRSGR